MRKILYTTAMLVLVLAACANANPTKENTTESKESDIQDSKRLEGLSKAYFASGCFWCVEAIFEEVKGVEEAVSGYAGGTEKNPTYEQVSAGLSSHAEAVMVYYNPDEIDFNTLVKVFFGSHDPTTLNQQGPDRGEQYRSIAFYSNEKEQQIINEYIEQLKANQVYDDEITTEVKMLDDFYEAEGYHQNYEKNNPNNSYIRNVSIPRLKRFEAKYPELLKSH